MKKIYCVVSGKYKKFKNPKILCIFEKTLVVYLVKDLLRFIVDQKK